MVNGAMPTPDSTRGTQPLAVVLLSGGLDSAVALACATRDGFAPVAVTFDYGQRHAVELAAAARVAAALGAHRHVNMKVDLAVFGGSALTDLSIGVPKDQLQPGASDARVPITYVPARNLIFISLAAALAETLGASDIYLGVNAVDYSGYPDCRAGFLRSLEATLALGTRAGAQDHRPWRLRAPLVEMSKAQIIRLGETLAVPFALTHSCYDPPAPLRGSATAPLACGHCDSCLIRRRGFIDAGVSDPTSYAALPVPHRPS